MFDGLDDSIIISNSQSLASLGNFSISFWMYKELATSLTTLINHGTGYMSNYLVQLTATNGIGFSYITNNINSSDNSISSGIWTHIVVTSTIDGTKTIYINNEAQTPSLYPTPYLYSAPNFSLNIGFDGYGFEYFKGDMDDIKIYDAVLTPSQVQQLYNNNTLSVNDYSNETTTSFYVSNKTLYFKNIQNLEEIKSAKIYNSLGQKVFETFKIENEIALNNLIKGVYVAKINTINGIKTLKFIAK